MKRIFFLIILLAIFVSAYSNSAEDTKSKIATGMAETLAAIPTDTPSTEGIILIPDVIGMTRGEAYDVLEKLGLVPKTFWVIHDEYQYGIVSDIEPGVGEIVQVDSEVVLDVVGEVVKDDGAGGAGDVVDCGPKPSNMYCPVDFKFWCECMGGSYSCIGMFAYCDF